MNASIKTEEKAAAGAEKGTARRWLHALLSCALSAALLYAVLREQSPAEFAQAFREIKLPWLYGYIALYIIALFVRAQRYRMVVELCDEESKAQSYGAFLIITAVRNALVDFLPARLGELSFFYIAKRYGVAFSAAVTAFGLCFALDIAVLFGIIVTFFATSPFLALQDSLADKLGSGVTITVVSSLALLILTACIYKLSTLLELLVRVLKHIAARLPGTLAELIEKLATLVARVATECATIQKRHAYPLLILQTLVLRVCKYSSLYILLISVVPPAVIGQINPLVSTVGFISAEAAASLPISGLMGFGSYEGAWTLVISLSDVEISSPTSLIFMVHLITQAVVYSIALSALLIFFIKELRNVSND